MRTMMIMSGIVAASLWTGCSKDKDPASGTSSTTTAAPGSSNTGLDVSVTPSGVADVYITDEKGNRINGSGATGRVDLPDGSSVPLTPTEGGEHMTAPLGSHESHAKYGCNATVHVTPRNGAERMARVDMCAGMEGGHMGPSEMEHGRGMSPGTAPSSGMGGASSGHGS